MSDDFGEKIRRLRPILCDCVFVLVVEENTTADILLAVQASQLAMPFTVKQSKVKGQSHVATQSSKPQIQNVECIEHWMSVISKSCRSLC